MSKRACTTTGPKPIDIDWPIELLIHIARQSKWFVSGPFARCNKTMFTAFIEKGILGEIVSSIKATYDRPMLQWLVLSLPSFMYPTDEKLSLIDLYKDYSMEDFISTYCLNKEVPCFVGGESMCREIYEKDYCPDSTIFVSRITYVLGSMDRHNILNDDSVRLHEVPWLDKAPERIIETADHSLLQQGFLGQTYYQTPLAVYTRLYKDVAIMPSDENMQDESHGFTVKDTYTLELNLWRYIHCHFKENHGCETITACGWCRNNLFIINCDNEGSYLHMNPYAVVEWFDRIDAIMETFSDFSFFWCKPARK